MVLAKLKTRSLHFCRQADCTKLSYDLDLVTHNPKDFQNIPGLRVLSIFK